MTSLTLLTCTLQNSKAAPTPPRNSKQGAPMRAQGRAQDRALETGRFSGAKVDNEYRMAEQMAHW